MTGRLILTIILASVSSFVFAQLRQLHIYTVDGEEPTCNYISAPAGCWGASITDANKVPARMVITSSDNETIYDSGEYLKDESGLTIKI